MSEHIPMDDKNDVVHAEAPLGDAPTVHYEVANMSANEIQEAYRAAVTEHKMGAREAVSLYKKGLFWSAVISLVGFRGEQAVHEKRLIVAQNCVMLAFDLNLTGSFFALPAFRRRFGTPTNGNKNNYQVDPVWQSAFCESTGADSSSISSRVDPN